MLIAVGMLVIAWLWGTVYAGQLAMRKGRRAWPWFWLAFFCGPAAFVVCAIVAWVLPPGPGVYRYRGY